MSVIRRGRDGTEVRIVASVYLLPSPTSGREDDWLRFHHFDLAGASLGLLWGEREGAKAALAALLRTGEDHLITCVGEDAGKLATEWLMERVRYTESRLREARKAAQR